MTKLTACKECRYIVLRPAAQCIAPEFLTGEYFDWYNGITGPDYENNLPWDINTDGHCKFFKEKEE